jgi:hypothetical protein
MRFADKGKKKTYVYYDLQKKYYAMEVICFIQKSETFINIICFAETRIKVDLTIYYYVMISVLARGNHEWKIQRHWKHWAHKTQDEDKQNKNTI